MKNTLLLTKKMRISVKTLSKSAEILYIHSLTELKFLIKLN